jgi:outer membrane biosynthesis protein TonB
MSEQQKSGGGFPMAFTAGLVVGLLVGAFAGVVIPPFFSSTVIRPNAATAGTKPAAQMRDEQPGVKPTTPAKSAGEQKPAEKPAEKAPEKPGDKPGEKPAGKPAEQPAAAPGAAPASEPKKPG